MVVGEDSGGGAEDGVEVLLVRGDFCERGSYVNENVNGAVAYS